MRIHHLAVPATVACVPLAACVPTYGSGHGAGYADGGYGYAPGPVTVAPTVVIAGGEYFGGGPYYGGEACNSSFATQTKRSNVSPLAGIESRVAKRDPGSPPSAKPMWC
jgi:hypothetical protein